MKMRAGLLIFASMLLGLTTFSITGCNKTPDAASTPGSQAGGSKSGGQEVSDNDVTTKVKTALISDDTLKGFDIAVVTTKGDVRLTGILDNQNQIDRANALARAVDGVHAIHDELTLKK
jgi:hyperosmotically inducible protein